MFNSSSDFRIGFHIFRGGRTSLGERNKPGVETVGGSSRGGGADRNPLAPQQGLAADCFHGVQAFARPHLRSP